MNCTIHVKSRLATAAPIAIAASPAVAADFDLAGGRLSVARTAASWRSASGIALGPAFVPRVVDVPIAAAKSLEESS